MFEIYKSNLLSTTLHNIGEQFSGVDPGFFFVGSSKTSGPTPLAKFAQGNAMKLKQILCSLGEGGSHPFLDQWMGLKFSYKRKHTHYLRNVLLI